MAAKVTIIGDNKKFLRSLDETGKRLRDVEDQMQDITKATERFNSIANKAFIGAALLGAPLLIATQQAAKFDEKMAEVATLGGTPEAIAKLREELLELSANTGIPALEATAAAYQAISAGTVDATTATGLLTQAAKLAIGGVTTLDVAVDALTGAVEAYGPELLDSTDKTTALKRASDILFVGMKAGRTTIGQLSENLALFSPAAAAANINMSEMVAALSAITTGSTSTNVAATQLRAILTAVAKATDATTKAAADLGLDFSFAALKSKGLAGFLADVKDKVGDNVPVLTKLFGSVEAVGGVISLTGKQSGTFSKILKDMNKSLDKTGDVTEIAFKRLLDTPARRQAISFAKWGRASIKVGDALLPLLDKFSDLSGIVADFISRNEWVTWTGVAGAGGLLLVGVVAKLAVGIINLNRVMAISQARARGLSKGLFTVRRAGKGAILALATLGIAGIIAATDENLEELSIEELEKGVKERETKIQKNLTFLDGINKAFQNATDKQRADVKRAQGFFIESLQDPRFKGKPQRLFQSASLQARILGVSRGDIGIIKQGLDKRQRQLAAFKEELEIRRREEELRAEIAAAKGGDAGGVGGIPDLRLGADITRTIQAPISQRIVKIDTLNIPLVIPETIDRRLFLDLLRDVFEDEALNAEGLEPVGS